MFRSSRLAAALATLVLVAGAIADARPIATAIVRERTVLHDAVFAPRRTRSAALDRALRGQVVDAAPTVPPTYSNPVDPTPPVPRPSTKPCIVKLFVDQAFAGDALRTATYTPPAACPGPWARVVFDWDTSVNATQYDRTGGVWLGGVEILRETTSEPPGAAIAYHTEKDVTEYTDILEKPEPFTAEMANYFASGITGIYTVNAQLEFYPASTSAPLTTQPDVVIPISNGTTVPGWATLQSTTQQISANVAIPPNTDRLLLEVYGSGHISDEFWYANVPDQDSAAGQGGGTSFREFDVFVNGQRAGIAWPFPYVYSGGFDPGLWIPITGIDTHDIRPYLVDLTPFVSRFAGGASRSISISVDNAQSFWLVDGDLLAYEDHGAKTVTGGVTADSLAAPAQTVTVTGYNATAGTGVFKTVATHTGAVTGYLNTSHGRVQTTVAYKHAFLNNFDSTGGYKVQQDTRLQTTTTVVADAADGGTTVTTENDDYPFQLVYLVASTTVKQAKSTSVTVTQNGTSTFTSSLIRELTATDVGAAGASTAPTNRTTYQYSDSTGGCYDRTMQAEAEMFVIDSISCSK